VERENDFYYSFHGSRNFLKFLSSEIHGLWTDTNYVMHYTFDPSISDLESYKQFISKSREAMPDLHVKIEDKIAEDDKVACRWVVSGTYTVDLFNIPALGKKATWAGMTIYRFKSGKIVESWWSEDIYGMLQQLGVIPTE